MLYGVLVAVGLSILDLLRRVAHAHDGILGFVPGIAGMHDIDDYPEAEGVPGLVVYRYDAPLCFANAEDFRERALAAVDESPMPVEWFVLNSEANVEVDLTALDALDQLRAELAERGIVFAMARVKQDLRDSLLAAGLILSILELLRRVAHAHDGILGFVPGIAGMHDIDDYPEAKPVPGLVVYRYDAPLCFANAEDFRERALAAVEESPTPVEWFVLNSEANVEVDLTALDALDQLRAELAQRGIVFVMARVKQDLRDALRAAGLIDKIGEDRIFMTLPTAVESYRGDRDPP